MVKFVFWKEQLVTNTNKTITYVTVRYQNSLYITYWTVAKEEESKMINELINEKKIYL